MYLNMDLIILTYLMTCYRNNTHVLDMTTLVRSMQSKQFILATLDRRRGTLLADGRFCWCSGRCRGSFIPGRGIRCVILWRNRLSCFSFSPILSNRGNRRKCRVSLVGLCKGRIRISEVGVNDTFFNSFYGDFFADSRLTVIILLWYSFFKN